MHTLTPLQVPVESHHLK